MVNMKSPVLLLGYNRPEYIKARLIEIMSWDPPGIYISIDGPKNENDAQAYKEINDFLLNYKDEKNITIYSNPSFGWNLAHFLKSYYYYYRYHV